MMFKVNTNDFTNVNNEIYIDITKVGEDGKVDMFNLILLV